MAKGVNKVILIGNVGNDPEVKHLPSGGVVTNLSVATSENWKNKETGQAQERTEWHRTVFYGRLAEIVSEYVRKGSKIYIEGSLRTRQWEQDGIKRYTTEIMANNMQMLDSRQNNAGVSPDKYQAPSQGNAAPAAPSPQQPMQQPDGIDSFDDDIPF